MFSTVFRPLCVLQEHAWKWQVHPTCSILSGSMGFFCWLFFHQDTRIPLGNPHHSSISIAGNGEVGSQRETNTNFESSSERLVAIHTETLCIPLSCLLDCASQDTGVNTTASACTAHRIFAGYKHPPPQITEWRFSQRGTPWPYTDIHLTSCYSHRSIRKITPDHEIRTFPSDPRNKKPIFLQSLLDSKQTQRCNADSAQGSPLVSTLPTNPPQDISQLYISPKQLFISAQQN